MPRVARLGCRRDVAVDDRVEGGALVDAIAEGPGERLEAAISVRCAAG
jgi:hypothetical protein